jgi:glycosyltransferase involved in cell wall biosynthesis
MKISVIMSTFNRAHLLPRAINSVLKQTYQDWELIVVDDNSKDDTGKVVKSFKDDRIRYIKRAKNSGCDNAPKNDGIKASQGDYIAFLDDDNEYRPDHLAVLLKEIEKDDTTDIVYGDRWIVSDPGVTNPLRPQLGFCMDFDPALLMERNFIDQSDVLIKRKAFFDIGGFDERYKKYVDWNVWVRMSKYGKRFRRVPIIITDYHLHNSMKSLTVHTKGDTYNRFVPQWDPYDLEVELPYLGKEPTIPKVAVFSITYDRLAYTKKSFKSLQETAGYAIDHFVVDNGSKDGTVEYLNEKFSKGVIKRIKLNETNEGISKASNDAVEMISHGRYDIVVKWDNDCIGLTKGWLAKMVEIWKSNHIFALSCYVQGLVDNPGGAPRIGYGMLKGELIGISKHIGGICHFVDSKVYEGFRWDENSFLHGVQDMEMSQYLLFHGFSQGYLENYFVSHGPQGTDVQKKDFPEYFQRRVKERQTRYESHK